MDEQNTFGGRVARYARVSTAVGGLAARMAGERYLGIKVDRDENLLIRVHSSLTDDTGQTVTADSNVSGAVKDVAPTLSVRYRLP